MGSNDEIDRAPEILGRDLKRPYGMDRTAGERRRMSTECRDVIHRDDTPENSADTIDNLGERIIAIGRSIVVLDDALGRSFIGEQFRKVYRELLAVQVDLMLHTLQRMIGACEPAYAARVHEVASDRAEG